MEATTKKARMARWAAVASLFLILVWFLIAGLYDADHYHVQLGYMEFAAAFGALLALLGVVGALRGIVLSSTIVAVLITVIIASAFRYGVVPAGQAGVAYEVDHWTGQVWMLYGREAVRVWPQ